LKIVISLEQLTLLWTALSLHQYSFQIDLLVLINLTIVFIHVR
jgi:hypothetical protein